MPPRPPHRLPAEPPPTVLEAFRKRLSGRELAALSAVFTLRSTAQQAENALTQWMAGTAGSPARFQILGLLWASGGSGVPHKEIVAALGVTRATVSELMAALERDGLLASAVDRDDRRNLVATLTPLGRSIMEKAVEANTIRLRATFGSLTSEELKTLTALLLRVRQGFAAGLDAVGKPDVYQGDKPRRATRTKAAAVFSNS